MSISTSRRIALAGLSLIVVGCSGDPVGQLVAELHDPNVEIRRAAARSFDEQSSGDERAIAALTSGVADPDLEVRYLSTDALGKLGPSAKSSLPALKSALKDSEKPVRLRAAFSIARIDPQEHSFVPVLTGAMRDGDGRTLLEIGTMGPDAAWAVPTLIGLLSHESPKVRALAAKALGSIGSAASSAKPLLEAAQRDPNPAVASAAKEALRRFQAKPEPAGK